MTRQIEFLDWGLTEYADAWKRQEDLFQLLLQNKKNADFNTHYVVFCQHFPVYTLGKNGHEENLLLNQIQLQTRGASFFRTNRGGDITFHGPGQVVGYFIFDLEKLQLGLKVFIYKLEEVIIHLLEHYGAELAFCYHARLCAQCQYRPELFQLHPSLRLCGQGRNFPPKRVVPNRRGRRSKKPTQKTNRKRIFVIHLKICGCFFHFPMELFKNCCNLF